MEEIVMPEPESGAPAAVAAAARGRPWVAALERALAPLLLAVVGAVVLLLLAITVGPRFLPYEALVVQSGSMSPTIPTGSVVFYRPVEAANVKVGDVIVFDRPGAAGERVTHRVYEIASGPTGRYFITKGDANGVPDDWRVPAVGKGWKAVWHIPVAGYVLAYLQSTIARLLLLLVPAALLALITAGEIWRDRKRGGATV
jgi:signal peptidase